MADGVQVTPGSGATVAADEISGQQYQRVKLTHGADGVNDGDVSRINGLPVDKTALTEIIEVVDSSNTYIGQAVPGTDEADPYWRIKLINVSGSITKISWADSTSAFVKVWDDRATYTYG